MRRRRKRVQAGTLCGQRPGGVTASRQFLPRLCACVDPAGTSALRFSQPTFPSVMRLLFPLNVQKTHLPPSTLAEHPALSASQSQTVCSEHWPGLYRFRKQPLGPQGGWRAPEPVPHRGPGVPFSGLISPEIGGRPRALHMQPTHLPGLSLLLCQPVGGLWGQTAQGFSPTWPLGICHSTSLGFFSLIWKMN